MKKPEMSANDVVEIIKDCGEQNIIPISVSCSSTRTKPNLAPHCGLCSQCIDRKFAITASSLDEDDTPYANNFVTEECNNETVQRLINTLRLRRH